MVRDVVKAVKLTDRVRQHLAEHGASTVRAMLQAFGLADDQDTRDRVSVAVNALVKLGAVKVVGTLDNSRGLGRRAYVYGLADKQPERRYVRRPGGGALGILDVLRKQTAPLTSRELQQRMPYLPLHYVRANLSKLRQDGKIVPAGASFEGRNPEIRWSPAPAADWQPTAVDLDDEKR